jgi:hypothetical protein
MRPPPSYYDGSGDFDPTGALPGWDFVVEGDAGLNTGGNQKRLQVVNASWAAASGNNGLWTVPIGGSAYADKYLSTATQGTETTLTFDWDVKAEGTNADNLTTQFAAYNDTSTAFTNAVWQLAMDTGSTNINYWDPNTNSYQGIPELAGKFTGNVWRHMNVTVDLVAQTYVVTYDGTSSSALPFVSSQSTIQKFETYTATNSSSWATGIDNVLIQSIAVPEPASAALAMVGLIPLLRRRSR